MTLKERHFKKWCEIIERQVASDSARKVRLLAEAGAIDGKKLIELFRPPVA